MSANRKPLVTVSCAFYGCHEFVADAVNSILAQTVTNVKIVVVNDGDPKPPWDAMRHIDDPRVVRYDLDGNYGPYFCHELVLRASDSMYFAVQDADDMSKRRRFEDLMIALELTDGVAATSFAEGRKKGKRGHIGLQRTDALRAIGGYYGGYKFGWDTMVMSALDAIGKIAFVPKPLYWVRAREGSLTSANETGIGSPARVRMADVVQRRQLAVSHCRGNALAIRELMTSDISAEHATKLEREAARLRLVMGAV